MILTIFRKIKEDRTGAVEIIESSLIFPLLLVFLGILFIISLKTINRSLAVETIYYNSRLLLEDYDLYEEPVNNKMGEKMERLDYKNVSFRYKKGFLSNSIRVYDQESFQPLIKTTKYDPRQSKRRIDFLKYIYDDLALDEIKDIRINELLGSEK